MLTSEQGKLSIAPLNFKTYDSPKYNAKNIAKAGLKQVIFTGAGWLAANTTTVISVSVGFEASSRLGILNNAQDPKAKALLMGAVIFNYLTNIKGIAQNVTLLEDKNIGACGNLPQVGVNKILKLVFPNLERTRKGATFVAGISQNLVEDVVWAHGLLNYSGGITALTSKELVAAAGGTIWIAGMSQYKKRFGEKKDINN